MVVVAVTVKPMPLLARLPTVTMTGPVAAPVGTGALMLVALQLVVEAAIPLNVTVLAPCVVPKFAPAIVTGVPTPPDVGLRLVRLGADAVTAKLMPLLARPPTVTTTVPLVAAFGTGTLMLAAPQLVGVAVVPLNVTVLAPCVVPKFAPAIVTALPTGPDVGVRLVRLGADAVTVKLMPLLPMPPTVTMTIPLVAPVGTGTTMLAALQLVGVAAIPLNVLVLVPCVEPKFAPAIVTALPTGPDVGVRLVMLGADGVTVKVMPLLARPPTVTTTVPVVAAPGTGTLMLVVLQFVGVAAVPLNLTVLVPWVVPKFAPAIVTALPTTPDVGVRLVRLGADAVTVKVAPLLATPPTVTTTAPVVAAAGTGTLMLPAPQLVGIAAVPLNVTVLVLCVVPKFAPAIVTAVATGPLVGARLVMLGDVVPDDDNGLKAANAAPHRSDDPNDAVAEAVPAVACVACSTINAVDGAGETASSIVYPVPAVKVSRLCVANTPINRSPGAVVVALPLLGETLDSVLVFVTSSAPDVATPAYSRMANRIDAEADTVTVTVLEPAATFCA
jgi:hypothetical protein